MCPSMSHGRAPTMQRSTTTKPRHDAEPTLDQINDLDRPALLDLWPCMMRSPAPRGMSKQFLRQFLGFELQSRLLGGLTAVDRAKIAVLADEKRHRRSPQMERGARFLREWNGVTHVVERSASGYVWRDQTYTSLSAIAKAITGAHWSGPRFFGIKAQVLKRAVFKALGADQRL